MAAVGSVPGTSRRRWVAALLPPLVVLVVWELAVRLLDIPTFVLPAPSAIAVAFRAESAAIAAAAWETTAVVVLGFLAGNLVGFVAAVAIASSPVLARTLLPLALGIRSVPIIALAPFLTLYLGRGAVAITTVTALIVFFPTLVNGVLGLRSADPRAVELLHLLDAGWWTQLVRLRLPASLPSLFAALRISAPSAVLGALIAEWVVSGGGLGYLILASSINARTAVMWAAVVAATLLAGAAFAAVSALERRLVPWAPDALH